MQLNVPDLCLVLLIGPSGCGKSTFGKTKFKPTEVISSDFCRGLVSDDENDQSCSEEAFELVRYIAARRLKAGKLTVIDATNVMAEDRKNLIDMARDHDCLTAAIVFDIPEKLCYERNASRPDRSFGEHVIRRQHSAMRRSLRGLEREGCRYVHILRSEPEANEAEIVRIPLWTNRKHESGPFDIIGDIHGCYDELRELLINLGYKFSDVESSEVESSEVESHSAVNGVSSGERANEEQVQPDGEGQREDERHRSRKPATRYHVRVEHPESRKVIFVGDLVDRGPKTPEVLRLVMQMMADGTGICVAGNHDDKLKRKLKGRDVQITHGLKESLEQLERESDEFKSDVAKFLDKLIGHLVFDEGNLVVAHAGMKEQFQGRSSNRVRTFGLYGETTGETDEYGLPVRYNWARDYRGKAMVVYGHTPVFEPEWVNRTICLDTGCVFGGKLTALRYPEKQLVSVKAAQTYYESAKPFMPEDQVSEAAANLDNRDDETLDIDDVAGKRVIATEFDRNIMIREQNANAALEVMSRFAVNPKWIIYLPPTMSPCETSKEPGLLEHPAEAFRYYLNGGINSVICEEKHMGSRAIVIVCKDESVAAKRFGVSNEGRGICFTRTGRRFFTDPKFEAEFISKVHDSIEQAGFWAEFDTDWIALDCELMPWSAKAQELLRNQYAAVGASALASLTQAVQVLTMANERNNALSGLLTRYTDKLSLAERFRESYRRYCWQVNSLADLKLAPFHLLATESKTYFDKDHQWHMDTLAKLASTESSLMVATPYKLINLTEQESFDEGIKWWQELTASGGEGMVVKPFDFIARGERGILQPAIKCRGQEYLRIIYGPEYTSEEYLQRLRHRGLAGKRSLAIREFALGAEALVRFVRKEPLYRVHECVFGVLALESEPVDPRL